MDSISSEEALGSVTQMDSSSSSSSVPLRSSARVSKKKLDSLSKIVLSPATDKKDQEKAEVSEGTEKIPIRKPTIWPTEDKDLFFEAVNEYGKDFAAIQRYFVIKNKNKNCDVKTKEQIRRFYYRTWAKIAHKLHFPPHIQKQTQELYGLINYGELRKKRKVRTKKDSLRLNELIIRGFTQLRGKNKTINIRTPRCRILRRLCRVEEQKETETRLPSTIRIALLPADNQTWAYVQSLAQNPRVHVHVPLQYRLSNLIQYLQWRWLPRHDKYKIKVMERYEGEAGLTDAKGIVVLMAKPNAEVHMAQVNLSHYNSHTKICLSSYEERRGKKGASLEILNRLYAELGTKMKKQKLDTAIDKEAKKIDTEVKEDLMEAMKSDADIKIEDVEVMLCKENATASEDINGNSASVKKGDRLTDDEEQRREGNTPALEEPDTATEELVAKVREGWTMDNCGNLTVGDVYFMLQDGGQGGPLSSGDATFRRPAVHLGNRRIIHGTGRLDAESFRAQMDKLTPKYCNRRGRGIAAKTVVVQRTLPILPKANNGTSVVTLKVIPQSSHLSGEFQPVVEPSEPRRIAPKAPDPPPAAAPPTKPSSSSSPSISTLLDETFKPFPPPANFAGGGRGDEEVPSTSSSPTTVLREGWLSEVTECSLSSLLSHLETPLKASHVESFESTPPDVESHFQYLMTEASLDFTAKFAALAAEVSSESSQ